MHLRFKILWTCTFLTICIGCEADENDEPRSAYIPVAIQADTNESELGPVSPSESVSNQGQPSNQMTQDPVEPVSDPAPPSTSPEAGSTTEMDESSSPNESGEEGPNSGGINMNPEESQSSDRLGATFSQYANEQWNTLKERSLAAISGGTDCAAFVSEALQDFGFDVAAVYTDGVGPGDRPEQALSYRLFELGFQRYDDPQLLQAGDICFTQDAYFEGVSAIECPYPVSQRDGYFPTHTYIFMEWEIEGSTAWAWVVDNQGERHLRNMTVAGPKDMYQYFVRFEG